MHTLEMVEVLRESAERLENEDTDYNWESCYVCNCGIVAQVALGIDKTKLKEELLLEVSRFGLDTWENMSKSQVCPTTGLMLGKVFSELSSIGFSTRDMRELERMSNRDVLAEINNVYGQYLSDGVENGESLSYYKRRSNLIKYLRVWADLIEKELQSLQVSTENNMSVQSTSVGVVL